MGASQGHRARLSAGLLAKPAPTVTAAVSCDEVSAQFLASDTLHALPVLDDEQRVIGLLRSHEVLKCVGARFFHEVRGRRSCEVLMDRQFLCFDVGADLLALSQAVSLLDERHLADGFVVTSNGRYFGSGRTTDLIRAVADSQLMSARFANPLTLLPGNVPIDDDINARIAAGETFAAIYFDLNQFKPYNDVYGYQAGDELIRYCARILAQEINPDCDFLGHVGGDDFVVSFVSPDWETRLKAVLARFDEGISKFYSASDLAAGGISSLNRQGELVFHPLVSLSAGVVCVEPGLYESAAALSPVLAEAKKLAKRALGSGYFIDRRRHGKPMEGAVPMALASAGHLRPDGIALLPAPTCGFRLAS
ncbi:MAG: diguanylate cyclase [Rhodocyclaceae bacterium]|nr:diguanylate cyclase [Rhodocyclaceae bacterium]MBK6908346.1 diguanylate cyclase [Rhodocyclaceae bacterium]